jgi:16S rRNA (cytosine1407-C5)-methyltransferase
MTSAALPEVFIQRLRDIIPPASWAEVLETFHRPRPVSVRINTLKVGREAALALLRQEGIGFCQTSCCPEMLVVDPGSSEALTNSALVREGLLYRQGVASALPARVLDPRPEDRVLDMCAAPGSKTTQLAARMENRGVLVAVEAVRGRYYKLKSVAALCGVTNAVFHCMDARRFRARGELFDKILLDAPCSSEARFRTDDPRTLAYWSPRKIRETARKQKGLILAASRLLKPGGRLVYSTCAFAPEENEGIVDWFLKKTDGAFRVESCRPEGVALYPARTSWQGKAYRPEVEQCCRVLPGDIMEGFFIASLKRRG